ncbi:MAG TPA: DUF5522 domain-containing protein [Bdellovibrionota bacterium]
MTDSKKNENKAEREQQDGKLLEGRDYYIDKETGLLVMTEAYLRKRGTCCGSGCRHCPYGFAHEPGKS